MLSVATGRVVAMEAEPLPFPGSHATAGLHIDCDRCSARGDACAECVVTVLLGPRPELLDPAQQQALNVLARSGMVPPLRLVTALDS